MNRIYGRHEFGQPCITCKAELIRTSEEYWCCPNGHGKLHNAQDIRLSVAERERKRLWAGFDKALRAWTKWLKKCPWPAPGVLQR